MSLSVSGRIVHRLKADQFAWCKIPLFCNICITLNTSTCFEQYYAHLQEVKIVFLQHLVSSLSVSGPKVHRLRADIKLCIEEQAKRVYQYKNTKIKLYKNNAAIWYNKTYRAIQLTPTYANIKIKGTNSRCQRTRDAAIRFRIKQSAVNRCATRPLTEITHLIFRVTIPDAVKIQFSPPEGEHNIARNMSRYLI
jgi:hypothetical protein